MRFLSFENLDVLFNKFTKVFFSNFMSEASEAFGPPIYTKKSLDVYIYFLD